MSKNDWKLITGGVGIKTSWVKKKIEKLTIGGETIIRDSRGYRLRARLLGHRRTPDKKHGRFNFHDNVK